MLNLSFNSRFNRDKAVYMVENEQPLNHILSVWKWALMTTKNRIGNIKQSREKSQGHHQKLQAINPLKETVHAFILVRTHGLHDSSAGWLVGLDSLSDEVDGSVDTLRGTCDGDNPIIGTRGFRISNGYSTTRLQFHIADNGTSFPNYTPCTRVSLLMLGFCA